VSALRSGKEVKLAVPLETAPELPREEITIRTRSPFLGAKVANLSPALAEELRLDSELQGVVILEVANASTAQTLGLQPGDIVVAVNGEKVGKTRDLERLTKEPSRAWRVTILRGGQQISAVFGG
jgi:S1-C subfamily serine protease